MYCRFFFAVFFVLGIVGGVLTLPAPLEITHAPVKLVGGVPDKEETENLARLKTAETDSNRQILKMEYVLNRPTVPQHAEMIHAAFGKDAKVDKIKDTVKTLKTGRVTVSLHTDPDPTFVASVNYDDSIPSQPGDIDFGAEFHDKKGSNNMRAATLVHEATHRLANTGDTIDHNGKMILGNDFLTPESGRNGYGTSAITEPAKSPKDLDNDKAWTDTRDGTAQHPAIVDMHNNAESYAQFASMCDAAISNAEVGLRRRALEERDWETAAVYLFRRQACAMRTKGSVKKTTSRNSGVSSVAKQKPDTVSNASSKKHAATPFGKSRLPVASASSAKALPPKNLTLSRGTLVKSRIPVNRGRSKVHKKSSSEIQVGSLSQSQSSTTKSQKEKVSSLPVPLGSKAKPLGRLRTSTFGNTKQMTSKVNAPVTGSSEVRTPTSRLSTKIPVPRSDQKARPVDFKSRPTVGQLVNQKAPAKKRRHRK